MSQQTFFDKIWQAHEIEVSDDGQSLMWVDRHFVHEGSFHAFNKLMQRGLPVRHSELTFGVADHYVPTRSRSLDDLPEKSKNMVQMLSDNAQKHQIKLFDIEDSRQGIVHVVGPELGLTLPGTLIVCGDSHTSTHGGLGALAFGIGASEVAHVLATQTLWQTKPKQMRIVVEGELADGVTAKDIALHWIALLGADSARGYAIEYAGSTIRNLSVEGRLTLCNLSIEAGGRCGMVAPDEKVISYLRDKPFAPKGDDFSTAAQQWLALTTDTDATFDQEIQINAVDIGPTVTWGVSPEEAISVNHVIPDPAKTDNEGKAQQWTNSLEYMGLKAGQSLQDIIIDRVFIGSCTNARLEDLRSAAQVLNGRKCVVPGIVSPGSTSVKARAESEGLDKIFINAGLEWHQSGCSMCVGMNGDLVSPGERCASSTNRNFKGRQGPGSRTHLMSPAMVAAAAVTGRITDFRKLPNADSIEEGAL